MTIYERKVEQTNKKNKKTITRVYHPFQSNLYEKTIKEEAKESWAVEIENERESPTGGK